MVVVYILLFIVCLSILIIVHELGHLSAAKLFRVYCYEFSVGFGPKIIRKKRKNGETFFAWRVIPFGGYVAMVGEENENPDDVVVPEDRKLTSIKKWKRAIIMVAGVIMNVILAFIIFFISEVACVQYGLYARQVSVEENGLAYQAGIRNDDVLYAYYDDNGMFSVDNNVEVHFYHNQLPSSLLEKEEPYQITYSLLFNINNVTSLHNINYDNFLIIAPNSKEDGKPLIGDALTYSDIDYYVTSITTCEKDEQGKLIKDEDGKYIPYVNNPLTINVIRDKEGKVDKVDQLGMSMLLISYYNSYSTAVKNTFTDFGNSATAIGRSIGMLFTDPSAFKNLSGPVGIGVYTTNVLQELGWAKFLYLWGLISVNLAIVNILPFPGLDGWHLLVLIVEGIAHKEIPNKVKSTIQIVGLTILFALMIMIIIKDFIML